MTNVVQFPTPANDDGDGGEHPLADVCRKFMQDCVDATRELAVRLQTIEGHYVPGTDPFDFLDDNRYAMVTLRNEARGFVAKWTKKGEDLGLPDEIIAMIVPQAAPIMATLDRSITANLEKKRPYTAPPPPPPPQDPLGWGSPLGASIGTLGIIGIVIVFLLGGPSGCKPYAWTGIHNGKISNGFGIRTGSGRHH